MSTLSNRPARIVPAPPKATPSVIQEKVGSARPIKGPGQRHQPEDGADGHQIAAAPKAIEQGKCAAGHGQGRHDPDRPGGTKSTILRLESLTSPRIPPSAWAIAAPKRPTATGVTLSGTAGTDLGGG